MTEYEFELRMRSVFCILMFAEMAEFTFSARIRSSEHVSCRDGRNLNFQRVPALVFLHSHGCRDGGICVFSADPQCLLILMVAEMAEFSISARARNLRFQRESAFCVRILMVAETAEFASLARICAFFVFGWLQRCPNLRFQRGSAMCLCIPMVAETTEYSFSARIRVFVVILMVAEMSEYAFPAWTRNAFCILMVAEMADLGFQR